jgi:hypothetical protein
MGRIGHNAVTVQARKRPLSARNRLGRGILVVPHRQRGFAVVQVLGWVGPMQSIREQLHLDVGIGLEGYRDLPGYGLTASVNGLRDIDPYKPGHRWHIVLPAAPDHGVSLTHQKAIAGFKTADRTIKIRQRGRVAPIDDVQEQPVVRVLERDGLEHAEIC